VNDIAGALRAAEGAEHVYSHVHGDGVLHLHVHLQARYPVEVDGETWRRLKVTFPGHIKTHGRQQILCFGPDGLLRRHDFTIDIFGGIRRTVLESLRVLDWADRVVRGRRSSRRRGRVAGARTVQ
jgi:hypothetical protein